MSVSKQNNWGNCLILLVKVWFIGEDWLSLIMLLKTSFIKAILFWEVVADT